MIRLVDGHDGRLVENDSLAPHVHEGVGGPEIDGQIVREHAGQKVVKHDDSMVTAVSYSDWQELMVAKLRAAGKSKTSMLTGT